MTTMKCRSCQSPMVVDRCESSDHATTTWHQCPLCKQVRLTSERDPAKGRQNTAEMYADDDIGYSAESEAQQGAGYLFS